MTNRFIQISLRSYRMHFLMRALRETLVRSQFWVSRDGREAERFAEGRGGIDNTPK